MIRAERKEVSDGMLGLAFVPSKVSFSCSELASFPVKPTGVPPVAPLDENATEKISCRSVVRPIIPPSRGGDAGSNPAGRAIYKSSTLGRMLERGFIYTERVVKIKKSGENLTTK